MTAVYSSALLAPAMAPPGCISFRLRTTPLGAPDLGTPLAAPKGQLVSAPRCRDRPTGQTPCARSQLVAAAHPGRLAQADAWVKTYCAKPGDYAPPVRRQAGPGIPPRWGRSRQEDFAQLSGPAWVIGQKIRVRSRGFRAIRRSGVEWAHMFLATRRQPDRLLPSTCARSRPRTTVRPKLARCAGKSVDELAPLCSASTAFACTRPHQPAPLLEYSREWQPSPGNQWSDFIPCPILTL